MDFEKEIALLYPWIVKVARKYCWSIQDAEDLANDTVYKALLNKDKFESGRPLKPWCEVIMQPTITANLSFALLTMMMFVKLCLYA